MMIGGNTIMTIETQNTAISNDIGERVPPWGALTSIKGWLDYNGGESKRTTFDAKVQESTHIFIADYDDTVANATPSKIRATVNGKMYDVTLIDNPMGLNQHLEIFLKYIGG